MQFRGKLPLKTHLYDDNAQNKAEMLRMTIDLLIVRIDNFAVTDARGWIK